MISLFISFAAFAQNNRTDSLSLLRNDKSLIHFYLERISKTDVSDVLLLIIQGSDCNSVSHNKAIHDKLRNIWPTADLLTVEKYGIDSNLRYSSESERTDCPALYLQKDNPEQRVRDLTEVLHHMRQKYNYKKIVVIGGSEGALIANMLTSKVDFIDATIAFSGGGRWFIDDALHSMQYISKNQNDIKKVVEGFKQLAEHILSSEPFEISMSNHGYAWWKSVLQIDQQAIIDKINSPLLIIQGGKDKSVSPHRVTEMINALRNSGNRHIDYYFYDELDHSLKMPNGESSSLKAIADMNAWLKDKIEKSPILQ